MGNPDGVPAVYLHGGPGGSLNKGSYRTKFDPARFRIIGLDQRGCGRSTPRVTTPGYDLGENSTSFLVDDIEKVREHLGVERWLVNGVSWGSTLALAYAQAHPHRVTGVVLMAVHDDRSISGGLDHRDSGAIYPEAWDRVASHAEQAGVGYRRGKGRLIEAYARLMTHADPVVRDAASCAWIDWEDSHVSIGSEATHSGGRWDDPDYRHVFATLVTHYWAHDAFLDPPILHRMERLHQIPATLIHGRRDVSGPAVVAWRLHRSWPGSELIVVEDEGHGGPSMVEAWCLANGRHADRLEREGGVTN